MRSEAEIEEEAAQQDALIESLQHRLFLTFLAAAVLTDTSLLRHECNIAAAKAPTSEVKALCKTLMEGHEKFCSRDSGDCKHQAAVWVQITKRLPAIVRQERSQ